MTYQGLASLLIVFSFLFFVNNPAHSATKSKRTKPGQSYKDRSLDEQIQRLATSILSKLSNGRKKPVIAVTDFTERRAKVRNLGYYVSEELTNHLHNSGQVKIIERSKLDSVMKEQRLSSSALFDPRKTQKLGKLVGANVIITGTLTDMDSHIKVYAKVISVKTGELVAIATVKLNKTQRVAYLWDGTKSTKSTYRPKEPDKKEEPARKRDYNNSGKDPVFAISLKATFPITVHATSSPEIYVDSFSDGSAEGIGIGIGLFFEVIPFRYLAIEAGIGYRTFSLGEGEVTFSEFHIPLILKLRLPVDDSLTIYLGAGASYFYQFSGTLDPDGDGPGQDPIDLPKTDLRDGFSIIAKLEVKIRLNGPLVTCLELGYEWTPERSLNITSHDLVFSVGIGYLFF